MKSEKIFDAVTNIDDKLIEDAASYRFSKKKKNIIPIIASLAAVFAVCIAAGFIADRFGGLDVFERVSENNTDNIVIVGDSTDVGEIGTTGNDLVLPPDIPDVPGVSDIPDDPDVPDIPDDPDFPKATVQQLSHVNYPSRAPYPVIADNGTGEFEFTEEFMAVYDAYFDEQRELRGLETDTDGVNSFTKRMLAQMLTGGDGENKAVSPLNVYMALCMLAETTDGNSRQQILSLLGVSSIEELRTQANTLWQKNYRSDGVMKSLLANSMWLNESVDFNSETIDRLSEYYFAEAYSGEMGSTEMNDALNGWISENTGGLLEPDIKLTPETVITLASTIYYNSKWANEFDKNNSISGKFNGPSGVKDTEYMRRETPMQYYWGDSFSAVPVSLDIGGEMWFILPDEGISADSIFSDEELLGLITMSSEERYSYDNTKYINVNMQIPKFDITGSLDIVDELEELGVTDVTKYGIADFSPLCSNSDEITLSDGEHSVRVKIDEEGVSAAAYTVLTEAGSAPPPGDRVDFILDRPFAFFVTLDNDTVLFAGVVNDP